MGTKDPNATTVLTTTTTTITSETTKTSLAFTTEIEHYVVIGAGCGCLLIISVILLIVFIWRKRRLSRRLKERHAEALDREEPDHPPDTIRASRSDEETASRRGRPDSAISSDNRVTLRPETSSARLERDESVDSSSSSAGRDSARDFDYVDMSSGRPTLGAQSESAPPAHGLRSHVYVNAGVADPDVNRPRPDPSDPVLSKSEPMAAADSTDVRALAPSSLVHPEYANVLCEPPANNRSEPPPPSPHLQRRYVNAL